MRQVHDRAHCFRTPIFKHILPYKYFVAYSIPYSISLDCGCYLLLCSELVKSDLLTVCIKGIETDFFDSERNSTGYL